MAIDLQNMLGGGAGPGGFTTNVESGNGQAGLNAIMNPLARNEGGDVTGISKPFQQTMGGAMQAAGSAMPRTGNIGNLSDREMHQMASNWGSHLPGQLDALRAKDAAYAQSQGAFAAPQGTAPLPPPPGADANASVSTPASWLTPYLKG